MAITECTECGKEISQSAEVCPSCGVQTDASLHVKVKNAADSLTVVIVGSILVLIEGIFDLVMADMYTGESMGIYVSAENVIVVTLIGMVGGIVSLIAAINFRSRLLSGDVRIQSQEHNSKGKYVLLLLMGILALMPGGLLTSFVVIIPAILLLRK